MKRKSRGLPGTGLEVRREREDRRRKEESREKLFMVTTLL